MCRNTRKCVGLDGLLLCKVAATEAEEIAQRLLIESNVSRHERPTEREERKGGTTRGLSRRTHHAHRRKKTLGVALEVVQQRLVLPVADGGIDPQTDSLECDPRMVLARRPKRLRGRSAHVFRNLQKMQMAGARFPRVGCR